MNPTSVGSLHITKQLSVPFVEAVAKAHWKLQKCWKFEPEREVPEVGDVGTLEMELPGLGLVKQSRTLRKYINTESYYEQENSLTSNLLPEVAGFISNVSIFYDAENPEKSFAAYRATWDQGEVSDVFKAGVKGLINAFEDPTTPTTPLTSMNPTSVGSLHITKQLSVPFVEAVAKANWKLQKCWKFEPAREVPEVGDVGILEMELPGLGLVKQSRTLRKYINTESYYEQENSLTSNLLPEVEGFISTVSIFYDAENPEKSFAAYRATWDQGKVSDVFEAGIKKGLINAFEDPTTPTRPLTPMNPMSGGSPCITKQLSVPFAEAVAKAHWKLDKCWKFEPEREVPEVGDVATIEIELPGLGLVKQSRTLRKYINTESYWEQENSLTSNLLPEVEGFISTVSIFYDAENPEKSFAAYRATWDQGKVSDVFKAGIKGGLINALEDPTTPTTPLTSMNPTSVGSLHITKHLSVPFVEAVAK